VACWWSQTRGAWLALFFAPLMAIFVLANIRTKIIAIITGVTMVIGISAAVYFELGSASRLITAWNQASEFFENPSEACTSIGIRLNMWRNVLIMLGDAPLFGVGLYGYQDAVKTLIEQGLSYNTDCQVTYQHTAHSIYFHTLAMSGVIGLFSLLLVFLGFIYAIYKAPANIMDKLLPLTIIFMFMLFGLTTSWTQKSLSTSTFLIFSILLVANLYGKHNEPAK
jgi:O-antigen ligase